jgi:hypothetical protein
MVTDHVLCLPEEQINKPSYESKLLKGEPEPNLNDRVTVDMAPSRSKSTRYEQIALQIKR